MSFYNNYNEKILEKDFVDVVNIGVNNLKQLEGNLNNIKEVVFTLPNLEVSINPNILMPSEWPK